MNRSVVLAQTFIAHSLLYDLRSRHSTMDDVWMAHWPIHSTSCYQTLDFVLRYPPPKADSNSITPQAVIIMGSPSDSDHRARIRRHLSELGVSADVRVSSAHKGTEETLRTVAEYEGQLGRGLGSGRGWGWSLVRPD